MNFTMKLNCLAPINDRSYGLATIGMMREFQKEHDLTLFPIGNSACSNEDGVWIKKCLDKQASYSRNSPSLKIWHQFALADGIPSKTLNAGMAFFELNKFKNEWPHFERGHIEALDLMLVSSKWAKNIVLNETKQENVGVVPLGYEPNVFFPNPQPKKNDKYVFMNVGKFEIRKGHELLCRAFNAAFSEQDRDVELWMSCSNPFIDCKPWENLYKNSKLGKKITILPWFVTQYELAAWMNKADCGVFPSFAEGWNLPALEMMACGKPLIISNYSAHTEFCNPLNSFLIEPNGLIEAYDGVWFDGFAEWGNFETEDGIEQLVAHMRHCYNNRITTNPNGLLTAEKYTWENSTKQLVRAMEG